MVHDPRLNKISRRTALALPLGLAASTSTIFNSLAKADQPVRGGTMVMIVQPEPSTLAHYAVTAGKYAGKTQLGIYELEGDKVKYCFAIPGRERPADFATKFNDGRTLSVWQREKK